MDFELPDGTTLSLADGATGADAAAAIGPGLARAALAVKVDGEMRDLARPLPDERRHRTREARDRHREERHDALDLIRHDAAHVLAAAVMELYPGVKISIGPPIEDGFYYDFDFPDGVTLSDADFERIEAKMREHIDADEPFVREDVSTDAALDRFRSEGQDYKVELIDDLVVRQRRAHGLAVHQRPVHGPVPRAARPEHQAHQGVQAAVGRRRVLARGLQQADAHARVRDGVLLAQGPPGRTSSGSSAPAPTTTAGSARSWGCSRSPRSRRARRSGSRPAPRCSTRWSRSAARWAGRAATPRSRPRSSTTARCGRSPATGTSTATTCS